MESRLDTWNLEIVKSKPCAEVVSFCFVFRRFHVEKLVAETFGVENIFRSLCLIFIGIRGFGNASFFRRSGSFWTLWVDCIENTNLCRERIHFFLFCHFGSQSVWFSDLANLFCPDRQFIVDCSSMCFSLHVFHFALKFSSRDSSPWTVLKGRIQFFFLFVSFISRWSSPRETVHRGLFSRGDLHTLEFPLEQRAVEYFRTLRSWPCEFLPLVL